MPTRPKYKAKHVFWDSKKEVVKNEHDINIYRCQGKLKLPEHIWRFDSCHEFKVYLELKRIYGADRIVRQYKLQILPPGDCYPKGKHWRVDFAVIGNKGAFSYDFFVEAKGAFLPEFATTLACLELHDINSFIRTFIVFNGTVPIKNQVVKALLKSAKTKRILTLQELEQSKTLL